MSILRGVRSVIVWLASGLSIGAAPALAADDATASAPVQERSTRPEPVLESTRSAVRSSVEWLARGVDGWFGDQPFEEGGKVTDGRISAGLLHRRDQGTKPNVRFSARFRLPNVEKSAYVFIGRDNERDIITDQPDTFTRQQELLRRRDNDKEFVAGLGLAPSDAVSFRLGFRGGLKPYAQARYSHPWVLSERNLMEFRQTLFWTVDDKIGTTMALSFEHAASPTLAARWLTSATITQAVKKVEWSNSMGAFKSLGQQRVLSVELLSNGLQGSGVDVRDYGLQVSWEQPLTRDWLLGELIVGRFWPRPDPLVRRGRAWALGANIKMLF